MASVYVETTIPSYLAAQPSRDIVIAAHQQITHEWWEHKRDQFNLFVSEAVLDEIRAGDPRLASVRMSLLKDVDVLKFTSDVEQLTFEYERRLGLTGTAIYDLPHFAFAVSYNMDYLLTWNCSHIANGHVIKRLLAANHELRRPTPVIVTPEELLTNFLNEAE